jgi:chemosensory pili system protein ChpA (sensor histidine kinase/response regulator)
MITSDREQQVRLQFLEEAQDYLDAIESGLLGLGAGEVTSKGLDAVMRAAHSIKGGAAMMGYTTLSRLGHRLEDYFKILQYGQRGKPDGELEKMFLVMVDRLRQIVALNKQGQDATEAWMQVEVEPTLAKLHDRLGDFNPEDEAKMLAAESGGEDILGFLFESEVERCLTELEEVAATGNAADLATAVHNAAEEMGALSQMVELSALESLCASVINLLDAQPENANSIAEGAIAAWRRTQAMVLIGQMDNLPTEILLDGAASVAPESEAVAAETATLDPFDGFDNIPDWSNIDLNATDTPTPATSIDVDDITLAEPPNFDDIGDLSGDLSMLAVEEGDIFEAIAAVPLEDPTPTTPAPAPAPAPAPKLTPVAKKANDLDRQAAELLSALDAAPEVDDHHHHGEGDAGSNTTSQVADQTIRIGVKQLDKIGDLFGELTLDRNGLNLQIQAFRQLVTNLQFKVQQLEQSNTRLRAAYDSAAGNLDRSAPTDSSRVEPAISARIQVNNPSTLDFASQFDLLEFDRYSELHLLSQEVMDTVVQIQELTEDLETQVNDTERTNRDLNRTANQIQTGLTQVRMRPLSDLLNRFPRALRNLSIEHGKPVELKIKGGNTLIERTVLEALNDPLMHLIRNAFDHGIEPSPARRAAGKSDLGTIEIAATYRGNQTVITIRDDGGGIDLEKIRAKLQKMGIDAEEINNFKDNELLDLIFEPGFSTASKVTDLSGRGVGMDVVRTNIRALRGDIYVDTKLGKGTTFTITVPFTLSVVRVLIVEVNGLWLAIPSNIVEEILLLDPDAIVATAGQTMLQWDDFTVRLVDPTDYLNFPYSLPSVETRSTPTIDRPTVLMLDRGQDVVAVKIDRFWGEQEVTIRQPQGKVKLPPGFTGCTILGDGRVVPLLDALEFVLWIDRDFTTPSNNSLSSINITGDTETNSATPTHRTPSIRQKPLVLVVDDSINVRRFVALTLEKVGYQVEQAKDGQEAVEKLQGGLNAQAVVCDIEMPRMDGYGFLATIKGQPKFKNLPVLMLTSRSGEKHRKIAMNLGATGYFAKPFKEQELLGTLTQLVGQP